MPIIGAFSRTEWTVWGTFTSSWRSNHGIWFARGKEAGAPTTGRIPRILWGAGVLLSRQSRVGDQEDTGQQPVFGRVYVLVYWHVVSTNTFAAIKTAKPMLRHDSVHSLVLSLVDHCVEGGCCEAFCRDVPEACSIRTSKDSSWRRLSIDPLVRFDRQEYRIIPRSRKGKMGCGREGQGLP